MTAQTDTAGVPTTLTGAASITAAAAVASSGSRAPVSQEEQARREAWGKKYGAINRDEYRKLTEAT